MRLLVEQTPRNDNSSLNAVDRGLLLRVTSEPTWDSLSHVNLDFVDHLSLRGLADTHERSVPERGGGWL